MSRVLLICCLLLGLGATAVAQNGKTLVVKPKTGPLAGRTLYTNSHALLIGIRTYQHLPKEKWLDYADADATALRETLVRSYGFAAENVTVLLNERATKKAIEDELAGLAED